MGVAEQVCYHELLLCFEAAAISDQMEQELSEPPPGFTMSRRILQHHENPHLRAMRQEDDQMIDEGGSKQKDGRLLDFHQLSDWRRDNEFIQTRYRPELRSHQKCFHTILGLHNQTGIIWSHMLGCMVFIGLGFAFFLNDTFPSR